MTHPKHLTALALVLSFVMAGGVAAQSRDGEAGDTSTASTTVSLTIPPNLRMLPTLTVSSAKGRRPVADSDGVCLAGNFSVSNLNLLEFKEVERATGLAAGQPRRVSHTTSYERLTEFCTGALRTGSTYVIVPGL